MTVAVKDWFMNKVDIDRRIYHIFSNIGTVERETEKAYLVAFEVTTLDGEIETTKTAWIPKSCTLSEAEYEAEQKASEDRFAEGCKAYDKLVTWCKENGVKGVRSGMRKQTIMNKIAQSGLTYEA